MKKVLLAAFMSIGSIVLMSFDRFNSESAKVETNFNSDYEEGWEDGFCEGWKDVKGQFSICPITPICPIPKISCSEGYKCGYNRGFKYGMCKAGNGNCEK
jgi:hypothetical protein